MQRRAVRLGALLAVLLAVALALEARRLRSLYWYDVRSDYSFHFSTAALAIWERPSASQISC